LNKNQKSVLFLSVMSIMILVMLTLYVNFLHDKPKIQAQEEPVLSSDQMIKGIKSFYNATTSNIRPPPPITP
jgi:hypothetical protein